MASNQDIKPKNVPIGIYRANITPIERLIKTNVGRQELLDDLVEKLERNAKKRGGQHYLFIGPRGIGKTQFLTLVENAVEVSRKLQNLYTVIRFPEENNRILSFADLLLGMIDILAEKDAGGEWHNLHQSLAEVEKDEEIIDAILPRLKRYRKETGKTLLLMLENLDTLFTQQMKKEQDIHRLRSFLMDSPCTALIGTSPVYFPGLYSNKSPFYDFFSISPLENLSEDETAELIRKNLEWEGRDDILQNFDDFLPKIYALHTMTGGNPRLNVLLYELIAHDNLLDVKVQFQKLLDQISPFYQDRLKDLAPQERALLETIALMRDTPRTPAAIAAKLRMKPQQASSLLKRMTDAGYLTVAENPTDKRSRIYCIKEGFFDLWLAMSESRLHRRRLTYLTQFFERYYRDRRERERKRLELWGKLEKDSGTVKENSKELLAYLSDVGDLNEQCSSKIELALHAMKDGDKTEAGALIKEMEFLKPENAMFGWITEKASGWIKGSAGDEPDIEKWLDSMVEYWKTRRSGDLEKAVDIAQSLAVDLAGNGLHQVRIGLLHDALQNEERPRKRISLLNDIAVSYKMQGMLSEALDVLHQALSESRKIGDRIAEGAILNNIGWILDARKEYDTALKHIAESLKIKHEVGDRSGEGTTLNNMGRIYSARGDYVTALKYFEDSLKIRREINNRSGLANSLFNLGHLELSNKNLERGMRLILEAWQIAVELKDAEALFHIGRRLGGILLMAGCRDEGQNILRIAYDAGKKAGFPEIGEVKALL
jgi:tetratricopeptide (TPR) repeat protein